MIRSRMVGFSLRLVLCSFLFNSVQAFAMPQFLQMFRSDPFRNPAFDGCNTCHMSPEGGDARNAFGQAFESGGERITPILRAQFPDRFNYPVSRVSETLTIHFSDPDNKQVVVETNGMKNVVDVERRTVNDRPATLPSAPASATSAAPTSSQAVPRSTEVPVDPYAREGAFFGSNIVNLPNGKPQKAGGVDFFIGHRFTQDVSSAGLGGLFGFDSSAIVAFGVRAGITNRLSVSVFRSNYFKTISLGSAFQISRQTKEMPITLQARAGIDGQNNFGLYHKCPANPGPGDAGCNPQDRRYSPFIQIVGTRTFNDRFSITAVPMVAFNTNDKQRVVPELALGAEHDNTFSLGIGGGVRFLPSVSLVGEYIPRLWGFKSELKASPGISKDLERFSIGLQKSTFRHTFELLISRQQPMTPALYSFQGTDTFRIGFNIYRKLR
jgi:hypothetical protein